MMSMQTRFLGQVEYLPTFEAMKAYTAERTAEKTGNTAPITHQIALQPNKYRRDQLWICEHYPVFTQGLAGKTEHVLNPGNIPVMQTDRSGQDVKTTGKKRGAKALQNRS